MGEPISGARALVQLAIVDIAQEARAMLGEADAEFIAGRPLPEHDYRFHFELSTGRAVTFGQRHTAADVMEYLIRHKDVPPNG